MNMQRTWPPALVCIGIVVVLAGLLAAGCEAFKPKPPELPPDDPEPIDVSGLWELELRTNGASFGPATGDLGMTLVQTGDEIEGNWSLGEVEGEVEPDGDIELDLNMSFAPAPFFFRLEGEMSADGDEMSGEWISPLPSPRNEGTWKAERE